jgi:hypothetical protein
VDVVLDDDPEIGADSLPGKLVPPPLVTVAMKKMGTLGSKTTVKKQGNDTAGRKRSGVANVRIRPKNPKNSKTPKNSNTSLSTTPPTTIPTKAPSANKRSLVVPQASAPPLKKLKLSQSAEKHNSGPHAAGLGRKIQIIVPNAMDESRDIEDEEDYLFRDLSLREDNIRLTRDVEYLRQALRIYEERDQRLRRVITSLNEDYVKASPSNFTVGDYRSYRYLHERLEVENRLLESRVPGGFRSLFAWDASWDVPFKALKATPYLVIRNGRLPVRPNFLYDKFLVGTVFKEFEKVEVSGLA